MPLHALLRILVIADTDDPDALRLELAVGSEIDGVAPIQIALSLSELVSRLPEHVAMVYARERADAAAALADTN